MPEALHKYADDNSLAARPGFKTKNVKYYIMFSANGDFLGFDPVTVPLMCPDIGSLANGTSKSNIIAEKAEVIFNIPEEKKRHTGLQTGTKAEILYGRIKAGFGV